MSNKEAANSYFETSDYDWADIVDDIDRGKYRSASFSFQQCIEKTLKALIYNYASSVAYDISHTHNMGALYDEAYQYVGPDETLVPSIIQESADFLDKWEVIARYPDPYYEVWQPDEEDIALMDDLLDVLPYWRDEVKYVIDNM